MTGLMTKVLVEEKRSARSIEEMAEAALKKH